MSKKQSLDRARLVALQHGELDLFARRTPRSRQLLERGCAVMPSGVPMSWMAGLYETPPVFVASAEGCRFSDVDGNVYLDMNQADLSMSCGFTPRPVVQAVVRQIQNGLSFLLPGEDAVRVAELLGDRFGLPRWQFTLSASGANAEAIRLARVATGRDKVLMIEGHYHGHGDEMLAAGGGSATGYIGLASDARRRADTVAFNDVTTLGDALRTTQYACLMAEPVLTNCGLVLSDTAFWHEARQRCRETGTLLVIDETHTQTFAWGGLTRKWGLDPDLVTLGKCIGGGIPTGAYGMGDDLARLMERNLDRHRGGAVLPTGGTLYANALSMAAARAALEQVLTRDAYDRADALGRQLAGGLNDLFDRHGLDWCAPHLGGRSGWCLAPALPRNAREAESSLDYELVDARRTFMANRGIFEAIASAGPAASFAHTEADIAQYLDVAAEFLHELLG